MWLRRRGFVSAQLSTFFHSMHNRRVNFDKQLPTCDAKLRVYCEHEHKIWHSQRSFWISKIPHKILQKYRPNTAIQSRQLLHKCHFCFIKCQRNNRNKATKNVARPLTHRGDRRTHKEGMKLQQQQQLAHTRPCICVCVCLGGERESECPDSWPWHERWMVF